MIAAIIGAAGTVIGAIIGRSDFFDRLLRGTTFPRIIGKWRSSWIESEGEITCQEIVVIEKQKGPRVYGYITMEKEPDKKWDLEGDFNGRFLRLFWHPSKDAENKLFLDYGCYFFEIKGDGSFKGYAVGFDWSSNKTQIYEHNLDRIRISRH